jgi:hypothetical protein
MAKYACTDCGAPMSAPGTCAACIKAADRLMADLKKKGKGK